MSLRSSVINSSIRVAVAIVAACAVVPAARAQAPGVEPASASAPVASAKLTAPKIVAPLAREIPPGAVRFEWTAVEGVEWYRWVLYRDGKVAQASNIKGTVHELKALKDGEYRWAVHAMKRAPKGERAPASAVNGWIQGERAVSNPFVVEGSVVGREALILIRPKGKILYTKEPVIFAWQGTAKDYTLTLYKHLASGKQVRVASVANLKSNSTMDVVPNMPPGTYSWKVSGTEPSGQKSEAKLTEFTVVSAIESSGGHGNLAIGYSGATFSHQGVSPEFETIFDGASSGVFAEGEYFLTDNIAFDLGFSQTRMTFQSETSSFTSLHGSAQFRGRFGKSMMGYGIAVGVERSSIPEVLGSLDPDTEEQVYSRHDLTRLSLVPRLMLTARFDNKTMLIVEASRKLPLSLAASDGVALTKADPGALYRVGATLQGAWFWPWGVRLDAHVVNDGAAYTTEEGEYKLGLRGYQFGAGLFYSF